MVRSVEFFGAVLGIKSHASTLAQRNAVMLYTHAYRINHLNIIFPFRRPGLSGLANFAIIIKYTPIQLSRYCVILIEPAARYRCIIPEPHLAVIRRNRSLAVPH
jgi:hypothetical protein